MKLITFPKQDYSLKEVKTKDDKVYKGLISDSGNIGLLELLWTCIATCPQKGFTKKEHKSIRGLRKAIKEITRFKDEDKDARVTLDGEQKLLLENDEYEIMVKLLEFSSGYLSSSISEELSDLWDLVDHVEEYKPKLEIAE